MKEGKGIKIAILKLNFRDQPCFHLKPPKGDFPFPITAFITVRYDDCTQSQSIPITALRV